MDEVKLTEQQFEHRTRRTALLTSIAFHLAVLALFTFWTCSAPVEPKEELTEIVWGGSGGSPDVDAPEGPAMQGSPSSAAAQPQPSRQQPRTEPEPVKTPTMRSPSTEKLPTTEKKPEKPKTPTNPNNTPTTEKPRESEKPTNNTGSSSGENTNTGQSGQREDGTGTKPAGGSGGGTSGYSTDGFGNRGWASAPSARYPEGSNASGTVVLRFTVQPNGEVTSIVPIKRADQALVNAAMAGLRRARARALPESAPQVPITVTITYRFVLQ